MSPILVARMIRCSPCQVENEDTNDHCIACGRITGTSEGARRFRSEIKLARRVSHPNVCRIHDYGREGHLTYISSEYIAGTDLKQELRRRSGFEPGVAAFQGRAGDQVRVSATNDAPGGCLLSQIWLYRGGVRSTQISAGATCATGSFFSSTLTLP